MVIACIRIISTYDALSLTVDEPFHFGSAIEYLSRHTFLLDVENPPVARAIESLGPYVDGARLIGKSDPRDEGLAILAGHGNVDRTVFLLRLGTLPFFLLACLVVGSWTYHYFGKPAAVLAVGLFTLLPTTLADSGLSTTDMALAATTGAAFLTAMAWAERPTWLRALLLGLCAALAVLSKFTALGYVVFSVFLATGCYLAVCRPTLRDLRREISNRVGTFLIALLFAIFLIWAAYWFSFGPVRRIGVSLPAPEFSMAFSPLCTMIAMGTQLFCLGNIG